jgi:hypothetical protein
MPCISEQNLKDILKASIIDLQIIGVEYKEKNLIMREYYEEMGIKIYYNSSGHRSSSIDLSE